MSKRAIAIIGAGGFGREVAEYIEDINRDKPTWEHIGFIDDDEGLSGKMLEGIPVWGTTESIHQQIKENQFFEIISNSGDTIPLLPTGVDVICAISKPKVKKQSIERIKRLGFAFTNIIHPTSYIGKHVQLGQGVIIAPGCIITKNISIGNHVSINPQCGIGHDVNIGDYTTLYWNVNVSGNVQVGTMCELGTKATILQGLSIGDGAIIGANAVVTKSITDNVVAAGIPAKYLRDNK